MTNTEITIHTDGSCLGNPGRGGWAAVVRRYEDGKEVKKRPVYSNVTHTTSNRMEMTGAIKGLRQIRRDEKAQITVYSVSRLLVQGMTEWVPKWQTNGWRKSNGKPVENRELWKKLRAATDGLGW